MTHEDFLHEYETALATHRWDEVAPLVHDSCAFVFSEATFHGREEARTAFEAAFSTIQDEEYRLTDVHWVYVSESFATCTYIFSWKGMIAGKFSQGQGRGTSVLTCEDGRWYLTNEHLGPLARNA
jgi:ketosteroid isomerase-like protein